MFRKSLDFAMGILWWPCNTSFQGSTVLESQVFRMILEPFQASAPRSAMCLIPLAHLSRR